MGMCNSMFVSLYRSIEIIFCRIPRRVNRGKENGNKENGSNNAGERIRLPR